MTISRPDPGGCAPNCTACGLRQSGAFTTLAPDQLAFIEHYRSSVLDMPAGGTLVHEQHPSGTLYTLYAGWAFRYKTLSDGRRQILNFLLPGDLIGLQQEFGEGVAMHGIDALTDIRLCVFPRAGLGTLFGQYPDLGYDVTWLAAREQGMLDDHLLTVGRRTAAERVAMLLMHLYRRLDRLGLAQGGSVEFPLTQQHIADALGLSLVHTNKTLRRLQRLGLHELRGGRLSLPNPRALVRLADYYDAPLRRVPLL